MKRTIIALALLVGATSLADAAQVCRDQRHRILAPDGRITVKVTKLCRAVPDPAPKPKPTPRVCTFAGWGTDGRAVFSCRGG